MIKIIRAHYQVSNQYMAELLCKLLVFHPYHSCLVQNWQCQPISMLNNFLLPDNPDLSSMQTQNLLYNCLFHLLLQHIIVWFDWEVPHIYLNTFDYQIYREICVVTCPPFLYLLYMKSKINNLTTTSPMNIWFNVKISQFC